LIIFKTAIRIQIHVKDPVYGFSLDFEGHETHHANLKRAVRLMDKKIKEFENSNFETNKAELGANVSKGMLSNFFSGNFKKCCC